MFKKYKFSKYFILNLIITKKKFKPKNKKQKNNEF